METEKSLTIKDESLPFKLMDALDDALIVAELEGRMPEILTYHFSDKGQEVWGLSKAGVDEATAELAKQGEVIREVDLTFTDGTNEAFFQVKAARYVINKEGKEILLDTKFGTKRQSKTTVTGKHNTFWYEQGSIKACRNASMRLIPKTIVQAVIENAKKAGKVKEVKGNGEQKAEVKDEGKSEEPQHSPPKEFVYITQASISKQGKSSKGTPWTLYGIDTDDGEHYGTFDKKIYELACKFKDKETPCLITWEKTEKGNLNIKELQEYHLDEPGSEG